TGLSIALLLIFHAASAQSISMKKIKAKSDSALARYIGPNFKRLNPRVSTIATADQNGNYDYFSYEDAPVPVSKKYAVTYQLFYKELDYEAEIEVFYDDRFRITDSASLNDIPRYVVRNTARNIITKQQAIEIAKKKGLAAGDVFTTVLSAQHNDRQLYWFVRSEWKKDIAAQQKSNIRRRAVRKNDTFFVNALTKQVFTFEQLSRK
ncbi:MAG: hypothetical protein WCF67_12450, partial [Chitinophagaceae bacterium]